MAIKAAEMLISHYTSVFLCFPACLKSSDQLHYVLAAPTYLWQEKGPTEKWLICSLLQGWKGQKGCLKRVKCWDCLVRMHAPQTHGQALTPQPPLRASHYTPLRHSFFLPSRMNKGWSCCVSGSKLNEIPVLHNWEIHTHRRQWGRNGFEVKPVSAFLWVLVLLHSFFCYLNIYF